LRSKAAVFVDRDGTLVREVGHLHRREQLEILPGVADAICFLRERGFKVVMVTNQSAVARGLLSEEGLAEIHQTLCARLAAAGAYLDGIYYCPHHPTEGLGAYNVVCDCRKPSPGLVRRAATDLEIDPAFSFVVGDQKSDMELAQRVGARGILIGEAGSGALPDLAVHVAADLRDAATWIVATLRGG
jgi:D-glycero-D-manno-heptose 1,7-bisphosphate phosphatase